MSTYQTFIVGVLAGIGLLLMAERQPFGVQVFSPQCLLDDTAYEAGKR